jgi:endogenous inhibitor of DNA gyrase (YacG/DUF329 family)
MSTKTDSITCPTCNVAGTWKPDNSFRPFCSYRCKLVDLGEWASEGHRIAGDPAHPDDDENKEKNDEE